MAIVVKNINKNGNKIIDYSCELNGSKLNLTRDELIDKINNKEVENARIQVYKGQIIIRVNLENQDTSIKNSQSRDTKTKQSKEKGETSAELMIKISNDFNLKHIEEYSNFFFEKNPSLKDKEFTSENVGEKIEAFREMTRFWRLVALKQIDETYAKWNKDLDEVEYLMYCKDNNLEYK